MKAHLKNLKKLLKNSIALLETLISVLILIVVVGSFSKIPYNDQKNEELFYKLNELENNFATKNYSSFTKSQTFLTIQIDENANETIFVNKYEFKQNDLSIFKYEK